MSNLEQYREIDGRLLGCSRCHKMFENDVYSSPDEFEPAGQRLVLCDPCSEVSYLKIIDRKKPR